MTPNRVKTIIDRVSHKSYQFRPKDNRAIRIRNYCFNLIENGFGRGGSLTLLMENHLTSFFSFLDISFDMYYFSSLFRTQLLQSIASNYDFDTIWRQIVYTGNLLVHGLEKLSRKKWRKIISKLWKCVLFENDKIYTIYIYIWIYMMSIVHQFFYS